ncbi:MAG: SDR family oxidoreductase [Gammaproteobacteria bacterium]|nr:SDR family oxidoreductase [Gammaproteobacteria bacterium]
MSLAGARALITGGAGGIGSAIAAELLDAGASVMLADIDPAALNAAASRLGAPGRTITTVAANLTTAEGRTALCQAATGWQVNVLVNSAGVNHFGLYDELTPEQVAQTVALNILSPMLVTQALLPHLKAQPVAHLLDIGSVFGHIGYPGYAAYCASKFALRGFGEALRRELAGSGVRVHHLAPRATRTRINTSAVEQMNAALKVSMDPPDVVARAARRVLEKDIASAVVGWPEKLFARVNAILPGVVDGAIAKQLPVIRQFARRQTPPADNRNLRRQSP